MTHTRQVPPVYLAVDLWMALGLDSERFDAYYERNGWADTWATLLSAVRGLQKCGAWIDDGDQCVLSPHSAGTPHYGAGDIGRSEPLPWRGSEVTQ